MLTIHVWPKRLKEFLLTHPLYKSPTSAAPSNYHPPSNLVHQLAKLLADALGLFFVPMHDGILK